MDSRQAVTYCKHAKQVRWRGQAERVDTEMAASIFPQFQSSKFLKNKCESGRIAATSKEAYFSNESGSGRRAQTW